MEFLNTKNIISLGLLEDGIYPNKSTLSIIYLYYRNDGNLYMYRTSDEIEVNLSLLSSYDNELLYCISDVDNINDLNIIDFNSINIVSDTSTIHYEYPRKKENYIYLLIPAVNSIQSIFINNIICTELFSMSGVYKHKEFDYYIYKSNTKIELEPISNIIINLTHISNKYRTFNYFKEGIRDKEYFDLNVIRVSKNEIDSIPIVDKQLIFEYDTNTIYLDNNVERVPYNFKTLENVDLNSILETGIYKCIGLNHNSPENIDFILIVSNNDSKISQTIIINDKIYYRDLSKYSNWETFSFTDINSRLNNVDENYNSLSQDYNTFKTKTSNDISKLDIDKASNEKVDSLVNGIIKQNSVRTYQTGNDSLKIVYGLEADVNGTNGKAKQNGWDVEVREDETKGGKSNRYNWNGEEWIDMNTGVYDKKFYTVIQGGNYIDKEGQIKYSGSNPKRCYSKAIRIMDGIVINHFAIVPANKIADNEYAAILLYDDNFQFVGYLTHSIYSSDLSLTLDVGKINSNYPTARYFRVNLLEGNSFDVVTINGESPFYVDEGYISDVKLTLQKYNPVVYGGNYINKSGQIIASTTTTTRGYSKAIYIVDGLSLINYSVVSANIISEGVYAAVILYDIRLRTVGYLTHHEATGSVTTVLNKTEIQALYPDAVYCRVNLLSTSNFSVITPDGSTPFVADEGYVAQVKQYNDSFNAIISGGNYLNKSGIIQYAGSNSNRAYTKPIRIANGIVINHFSVVSANKVDNNNYAAILLYDNTFSFVGYLTHNKASEDLTLPLDVTTINANFPTAMYFKVNLINNGAFYISTEGNKMPFFADESFVNQVKQKQVSLEAMILGGGYLVLDGSILQSTFNPNRGYTKPIWIVDGLRLNHFAITNSSKLPSGEFASVFLYDKFFNIVGYLTNSQRGEDFSQTLNLAEIRETYPTARYCRVNVNANNGFYISTADGSLPPIVDEGYVYQTKNTFDIPSRQIYNPPLPKFSLDREIKILAIGSSWLNDTVIRVRDVALASGVKVNMANVVIGGATYEQIVEKYNTNEIVTLSQWDSAGAVGSPSITTKDTFHNIITMKDWDVIIVNQGAKQSYDYSTFQPHMSNWISILKTNATNPNVFLAMNSGWTPSKKGGYIETWGYRSQEQMWEDMFRNINLASYQSGIDLVIPCTSAIYSLRTTSMMNESEITRDELHLDNGIGIYTASCTFFEAILKPIYGVSILGNTYRSPDQVATDKYTPVTDANAMIAQKCAISANANRFGYVDFSGLL